LDKAERSAILKRFGATVRARRRDVGISQEELADRAELDRTYIGGIERGERNVSVVNIVRIARALDVAPSLLLIDLDTQAS
jgi:transcriptional regulator with XRE-family HTH domain